MQNTDLPHPQTPNIPVETLRADYLNVTVDRSPDPRWRFKLNLHRSTNIAPGGEKAPTATDPFQPLALFQRDEPRADLEVFGVHLPVEIDPADWLGLWIERHGMTKVSSTPLPTAHGVFGDAVCTWDTPQGEFAGRLTALRWGSRVFLLALRTPRASYASVADDYLAAMASFAPLDASDQDSDPEPRRAVSLPTPLPATVRVPESYDVAINFTEPQMTAFSGDQQPIPSMSDDPAFGKLTVIWADLSAADHPAKAASLYLDPLLQNPITLHGDEFLELEGAPPPFLQAWSIVAAATLTPPAEEPVACELRCQVLAHEKGWLVAGVLGPARHAAPIAWARNKRALDVVTSGIAISENG